MLPVLRQSPAPPSHPALTCAPQLLALPCIGGADTPIAVGLATRTELPILHVGIGRAVPQKPITEFGQVALSPRLPACGARWAQLWEGRREGVNQSPAPLPEQAAPRAFHRPAQHTQVLHPTEGPRTPPHPKTGLAPSLLTWQSWQQAAPVAHRAPGSSWQVLALQQGSAHSCGQRGTMSKETVGRETGARAPHIPPAGHSHTPRPPPRSDCHSAGAQPGSGALAH